MIIPAGFEEDWGRERDTAEFWGIFLGGGEKIGIKLVKI
jgi:hypothetical protein